MAFIRIPNCVGVDVRFTVDGKPSEFGFTYELPTAPVLSTMQAIASSVVDWVSNELVPHYPALITFNDIYTIDLDSAIGPAFTWVNGTSTDVMPFPGSGSGIGTPTPNQAALVSSQRTGNRGRSYRGRIYFPVVSNQYIIDALTVSATLTTAVANAMLALESALAGHSATLVVPSRFTGGSPRAVGIATPVTEFIINTRVDTQRRRVRP